MKNPQAIMILGMHRSGTSCLAGSLQSMGIFLGEVNTQAPHNKKGNRENYVTWSINDRVLELSGGSWDEPPKELTWDSEAEQMRDAFIASYAAQSLWGFKDPRSVLTLPFWLESHIDFQFIGSFRNPVSVVSSLAKRNGFSKQASLKLWSEYNSRLLKYHDQHECQLINFDIPPDAYQRCLHKLVESRWLKPDSLASETPNFYDRSLVHNPVSQQEIEALPDEYADLYASLCERSLRP
jgi:hypothetical protein